MVLCQVSDRLEKMGLILRGKRSGLYIPQESYSRELCAFITSVSPGNMENYYESLVQVSSEAGVVPMIACGIMDTIEAVLEKKPLRVFIDTGSKNLSYNQIQRLTENFETVYCNRFEYAGILPESGVLTDWRYITEMTLRHFIKNGHKKILFISHNPSIFEYKHLELCEAAEKVGMKFDSPEFQWCSFEDFQNNPARISHIFRADPPTAVFGRGDAPVNDLMQKIEIFFPDLPEIEKIGAFDSFHSKLPGREFSSWHWDWKKFWKQVFLHREKSIEYYRPELIFR
jgi:DNA-binding LacI/PurR family transcriptional regulator